jgi:hypothetical protein
MEVLSVAGGIILWASVGYLAHLEHVRRGWPDTPAQVILALIAGPALLIGLPKDRQSR